mmetsp:Transcript_13943/g.21739  ORF Transcript_13943/g.21739 Transcript_13943/m.21739 type:complete len:220 (-) Transcript_13943:25-684(-)
MTSLQTSRMQLHSDKKPTNCNVPKVRFLGTLKDWLVLRKKITYLDRFGCHKWLDSLLPVINKFIAAVRDGEVDKTFWEDMYSVVPQKHSTSKPKVHGWICNFFPYTAIDEKEMFSHQSTMKKMFRERGTKYAKYMVDEDDFYRGVTATPLSINKKEFTLATGFIGVEFYNELMDPKYPDEFLQYVKPAVGWAVYEEDPSLKKEHPNVFIAADTAGEIFK